MALPWSHSGSHGGVPDSFPGPGTRAGSLQCLLRKYLLMEQETFGFVFPAQHKWHLQNCGIPGSMEITQSLSSFLHRGSCWNIIKWWVTVKATPTKQRPKLPDLNRACMASLKLSAPLTLLHQCCQQLPIPNTAASLLAFRGPGSLTLWWAWSRWREQGRRGRTAMPPICKERQGYDQPQAWPWLTSFILNRWLEFITSDAAAKELSSCWV